MDLLTCAKGTEWYRPPHSGRQVDLDKQCLLIEVLQAPKTSLGGEFSEDRHL